MRQPFLQPQRSGRTPERTIYTVSQLNRKAKKLLELELGAVWIEGEISNLVRAASGHWYFTLKDNQAQIKSAMFKFKNRSVNFTPNEGDKVVVKGNISLYEARGDYQLIADYMEPSGLGQLQQQLNLLIEKLQKEGLFEASIKKPLPNLPKAIGVITSATGAAVHDVITVLNRRCPMVPVIIYPTQVQGAAATTQIIKALHKAQSMNLCDVLLMTRGGGSLEDLWCFNDEQLAREIARSEIPVVAAIGHEVDLTITELVADLRAATPSAAAELLVPEQQVLWQKVDLLGQTLFANISYQLEQLQSRLNIAKLKLRDPEHQILRMHNRIEQIENQLLTFINYQIKTKQQRLNQLEKQLFSFHPKEKLMMQRHQLKLIQNRLIAAIKNRLIAEKNNLKLIAGELNALSPLATLERGYSVTRDSITDKVITKVSQVSQDQQLSVLLSDGKINCQVL